MKKFEKVKELIAATEADAPAFLTRAKNNSGSNFRNVLYLNEEVCKVQHLILLGTISF